MSRTKASSAHYVANTISIELTAEKAPYPMTLTMQVSNNDIAYKYALGGSHTTDKDEPRRVTILSEDS